MAIRDVIEGLAIGAAVGTGNQAAIKLFREQRKDQAAKELLQKRFDSGLAFKTAQEANESADEIIKNQPGTKVDISFDNDTGAYILDKIKKEASKNEKSQKAIFSSVKDLNDYATENGLDRERADITPIITPDGERKLQATFKPATGSSEKDKVLVKLMNDIASKGGDLDMSEFKNLNLNQQIDLARARLSNTIQTQKSDAQKQSEVESLKFNDQMNNLIGFFEKGMKEAKIRRPGIEEPGFTNSRFQGALEKFNTVALQGENPELGTYFRLKDGFVSLAARRGGENGVLTNQDIARFAKAFPDSTYTKKENDLLINNIKKVAKNAKSIEELVFGVINVDPVQKIETEKLNPTKENNNGSDKKSKYVKLRKQGLSKKEAMKILKLGE